MVTIRDVAKRAGVSSASASKVLSGKEGGEIRISARTRERIVAAARELNYVVDTRARLLAGQIRRVHPNAKVIVGGIHATLVPDDFKHVADHIVQGEAEEIIVDLVEGRFTEQLVQGHPVEDLESLPLINYRLLEGYERMDIIPIMTSRGCPFDCSFCTVTKVFGRRYRKLPAERVIAEVENALSMCDVRDFFFYDDNFTANLKRVHALCDLMLERNLDIAWTAQVRADLSRDPELVRKMVATGCHWVCIGFESINDETLAALNKSQTRADIETAIRTLHACGLSIHGMFMFGEDHDPPDAIEQTVQFTIDNHIETVQFMILVPFPGTRVYEEITSQNRLLHTNWDYYNGMFICFRPKRMSPLRLQQEAYRAYQRFYSLRRSSVDALKLVYDVFLDALVWNFSRAHRYRLNAMLVRGGGKVIVVKSMPLWQGYVKFLTEIERESILAGGDAAG